MKHQKRENKDTIRAINAGKKLKTEIQVIWLRKNSQEERTFRKGLYASMDRVNVSGVTNTTYRFEVI